MQPKPLPTGNDSEDPSFPHIKREAVGVLSTSTTALQQVAYLLARDGVGVSQAMHAGLQRGAPEVDIVAMLEALQYLQGNRVTEVILLVAQAPSSDTVRRVLGHVQESDKPTVACFLGTDQRLLWQAGAIPAGRLDEAAMRAAAWVRGWDQALVSSRLEYQDERFSTTADGLRSQLGPGRRGLCGLFTSRVFHCEAQLALSHQCQANATSSGPSPSLALKESVSQKLHHLRNALGDPELAVVLVDTVLSAQDDAELSDLLAALQQTQAAPLIITHVCGSASDLQRAAVQETRLRNAGFVVAPSNAAAAYLAGSVIGGLP